MAIEAHNSSAPQEHFLSQKPFLIEIRQDRPRPHGAFVPAASLKITEELRTSGLLHALPPEELKSLVYLLTFLSPEGNCSVSLPILTSAMRASSGQVKNRMHRLSKFRFKDYPLITEIAHESGLCTYSLHARLVAYEHLTVSEPHPTTPLPSAARQRIITHSRNSYSRPRGEVEQIVAGQLGHDVEETAEQRKLRIRLENVGLTGEQARDVLATYAPDVIAQQLDWLPFRNAKNPAGYLLAAIDGHYQEPRAIREQRFVMEERFAAEGSAQTDVPDEVPDENDPVPDIRVRNIQEHNSQGQKNQENKSSGTLAPLEIGGADVLAVPEE
jgi:hypothetical protein